MVNNPMSKFLLVLSLVLVTGILYTSSAYAIPVNNNVTTNASWTAGGSDTRLGGLKFIANQSTTIVNVTKLSTVNATMLGIYNATAPNNLLKAVLFSGDIANLNYNITYGTSYLIAASANGSGYNYYFKALNFSVPQQALNFTNGTFNDTTPWGLYSNAYNIYSITTDQFVATNFTITAINNYTGIAINTFNASVQFGNGTIINYTTTTGSVNTGVNNAAGVVINATITASGLYFTNFTINWNVTTNLVTTVFPWANITASDRTDYTTINTFNVTFNGTTYSTTNGYVQVPAIGTYNASTSATNYFDGTINNGAASSTRNVSMFQAQISFEATELGSLLNVTSFTVSTGSVNSNGTSSIKPVLYVKAGTYNFTFNKTGWYNTTKQITVTVLENDTQFFVDVYRYLLNVTVRNQFTGAQSIGFTINITSTTNGFSNQTYAAGNGTSIPWFNDSNFNISIGNSTSIANVSILYNTSNFTFTPVLINITVNSFTINSVLFSVYNETTQTQITQNVSITMSGTYSGYNFTFTGGSVNATLVSPDTYTIVVSSGGYTSRQYIKTITNQTVNSYQFFLLPTGYGTVLLSNIDKTYKSVTGYTNSLLRLNASSYNLFEVERCIGDNNGQCLVSAQICTTASSDCAFYKVVIYDPSGSVVADSGLQKFNSNTLPLVINNDNPIASVTDFFGRSQYLSNIDPVTGVVYYYADNNDGLANLFVLTLQRRIGTSYVTLETVSSTSTGTIALSTSGTNTSVGDEFIAYGYYVDNQGITHLGDKKSYSPTTSGIGSSKGSAISFVGLGLVLAPLLIFGMSPIISIVGAIAMLFAINFTGLATLTTNAIGGIAVIGAIVLWRFFK